MKQLMLFLCILLVSSLNEVSGQDTTAAKSPGKVKTGWNLGALPVIAYNTDIGFKYGGLVNFYNYGDGSRYPKYDHSIYMELSRTTKGGGINMLQLDSRRLIPNVRTLAEAALLTEKGLDFFGYNGYKALYNPAYEDPSSSLYISRMFYNMERKMYKFKAEFYGDICKTKFKWFGGMEFFGIHTNTVDINTLNKGQSAGSMLPDTALLYDRYVQWGVIPQNEQFGGNTTILKTGIIYDTRDNEANPMKGMWTEALLLYAPSFLSTGSTYLRYALTHRQYFTLVPDRLSFVYRMSYQGKLAGTMPFYMLPFTFNTAPNYTRDGLGGNQTMRGIIRNRVVGQDFFYTNIETRWKFYRGVIFNQNIYLALSAFIDAGMTTRPYKTDLSGVPAEYLSWFDQGQETLHTSAGGGFRVVMNENFIVAVDMGKALDRRDGVKGLYIFLSWLF